jgi:hypothetical protein
MSTTRTTLEHDDSVDVVYVWCGLPENNYCSYNDELYYSIQSVHRNMPWCRKIWVIINDDFKQSTVKPNWLEDDKVQVVYVSSFVPKKYLPVIWNSNVIESWIWKIKEISDKFVYFCDDMFIGQPVVRDFFFTADGKPINRYYAGSPDHIVKNTSKPTHNEYVKMWVNAIEKHNIHYTRIQHQALPYRKRDMKKYYTMYADAVDKASMNKTRAGEKDFNLLRFTTALTTMYGDAMMQVTNDEKIDYFVESTDIKGVKRILKLKPKCFCINNTNKNQKHVYDVLKSILT